MTLTEPEEVSSVDVFQTRLSDLKFLDRAGGNVGGGGADGFVPDVNTIYFDTRRTAVTATKRDEEVVPALVGSKFWPS